MTMRAFLISLLTGVVCLGFFGTALASESDFDSHARALSSEAGDWQYNFDSSGNMPRHSSMLTRHGSEESHRAVSTEAGDWKFDFDEAQKTTRGEVAEGGEYRMPKCSEC